MGPRMTDDRSRKGIAKMKRFTAAALLALVSSATRAQDPLVAAPQAYKLVVENDWVQVVRVHYGPKEKVVAHDHTPLSTAYVYLNDSGPVVFNHLDLDYSAVTRPATKAGSFRIYYGLPEVHEVINTSDLPSDFLRVQLKTRPKNDLTFKGKFFREEVPVDQNSSKVQVDHDQARITRLVWAPGKSMRIATGVAEPALLVALTPATMNVTRSAKSNLTLTPGAVRWIAANDQEELENAGGAPAEFLRIDFKMTPLSKEELDKKITKPHAHPKG
jgi:hypothetical protein